MNIFPAIDLKDGKCVRLYQGKFDEVTTYNNDPVNQAMEFVDNGLTNLHVVDLDGAKTGVQSNSNLITELCSINQLSVQVGGGVRNLQSIELLLKCGASRVIVGTAIFRDKGFIQSLKSNFSKEQIVIGLDFKKINDRFIIHTHGWDQASHFTMYDFLEKNDYFYNILATDISLDGAMKGPNIEFYQSLLESFPWMNLIASGGISNLQDIINVKNAGMSDVIVGKALYEEAVTLEQLCNAS